MILTNKFELSNIFLEKYKINNKTWKIINIAFFEHMFFDRLKTCIIYNLKFINFEFLDNLTINEIVR